MVGKVQYLIYLVQLIEFSGNYFMFVEVQKICVLWVYVGVNDGMLYGFDIDGNEIFVFILSVVFEKFYKLIVCGYQGGVYQFYVDGLLVVVDVFFGGVWYIVLIGSLCVGGKGLFVFDVIDFVNIKLFWEIGVDQEFDFGYSFFKFMVVWLYNGKWVVVIGNGYFSLNDKVVLLIIDLEIGVIICKLEVIGRIGVFNGLFSFCLVDNNSDGVVDYVYVGDL